MTTRPDLAGLIVDLASSEVDFVLCGGVACVLHGVERVTMDLDVRVPEEEANYRRLVAVLDKRGMVSRIPEPMSALCDAARRQAWVEEKGALVWTAQSSDGLEQIDIFLSYPVSWEDLVREAKMVTVRGFSVRISSREHLILAKRRVTPPRRKDLRDIEDLEALA
ncbi:MAG: hypothetical protein RL318_1276 [Fibrobacterota bacterium]|jgi:hypothetical protein